MTDDWRPTCSLQNLKLRAVALNAVRNFFADRDFLEVETPLLSQDVVVDAHLDPFQIDDGTKRFLQTSPEAAMKRLVAAGAGSVFQICKAFRQREIGRLHNPEFTMVEWYAVGSTWQQQMNLTEELIRSVSQRVSQHRQVRKLNENPFGQIAYWQAFQSITQQDVRQCSDLLLRDLARSALPTVSVLPEDRDDILNLLLSEKIEPDLGDGHPEFLHSYPISQAALAEASVNDPESACRFELYWNGTELCNGYQELCDIKELQRRDRQQNRKRSKAGTDSATPDNTLPGAGKMNAAITAGLPPCSGVALGFDRLLMLLLGLSDISQVIAFPWNNA